MKKIILGTAQFNGKYGVSNKNKNFNLGEIKKIINYSLKNKIKNIDTALSYFSDPKIYKLIKTKFNICTKVPSLNNIRVGIHATRLDNTFVNLFNFFHASFQ